MGHLALSLLVRSRRPDLSSLHSHKAVTRPRSGEEFAVKLKIATCQSRQR